MATQVGRSSAPDTAGTIGRLRTIAETIESTAALLADLRADRDRLVVELHQQGWSEREIADIGLMTGPRVHQILTKERP